MTRLIPIECVYSGILCGSFTAVLMSKQSVLEGAKMENGKGVANHAVFT
jgi:phosphoribosylaminoimidazole-succinocarboxamide synthase